MVYLRQSSIAQVRHNLESQRLPYALKDTARAYGLAQVEVIDVDLGMSAATGAQVPVGLVPASALDLFLLSNQPIRLAVACALKPSHNTTD